VVFGSWLVKAPKRRTRDERARVYQVPTHLTRGPLDDLSTGKALRKYIYIIYINNISLLEQQCVVKLYFLLPDVYVLCVSVAPCLGVRLMSLFPIGRSPPPPSPQAMDGGQLE
jgi:hypothetical protein